MCVLSFIVQLGSKLQSSIQVVAQRRTLYPLCYPPPTIHPPTKKFLKGSGGFYLAYGLFIGLFLVYFHQLTTFIEQVLHVNDCRVLKSFSVCMLYLKFLRIFDELFLFSVFCFVSCFLFFNSVPIGW